MERVAPRLLLVILAATALSGCVTPAPYTSEGIPDEWLTDLPKDWYRIRDLPPLLFNGVRDVAATPAGPVVMDWPAGGKTTVGLLADNRDVVWFRILEGRASALTALQTSDTHRHPSGLVALVSFHDRAIRVETMDAETGDVAWVREVAPVPVEGLLHASGGDDVLVLAFAPRAGFSVIAASDARGNLQWRGTVPGHVLEVEPYQGGAYVLYLTYGPLLDTPARPDASFEYEARVARIGNDGHVAWDRNLPALEARSLTAARSGLGLFVLANDASGQMLRYDPQGYLTHFQAASCPVSCRAVEIDGHGIVVAQDRTQATLSLVLDPQGRGLVVPTAGLQIRHVDDSQRRIWIVGEAPAAARGLLLEVDGQRLVDHLATTGAKQAAQSLIGP